MPFNASSLDELFDKIATTEPPSANRKLAQCGPGFVHLLQELLRINPRHRWSATMALRHQFVRNSGASTSSGSSLVADGVPLLAHKEAQKEVTVDREVAACSVEQEEAEEKQGGYWYSQVVEPTVDIEEDWEPWLPPPSVPPPQLSPSPVDDNSGQWPRNLMRKNRSASAENLVGLLNAGSKDIGTKRSFKKLLKRPTSHGCLRDLELAYVNDEHAAGSRERISPISFKQRIGTPGLLDAGLLEPKESAHIWQKSRRVHSLPDNLTDMQINEETQTKRHASLGALTGSLAWGWGKEAIIEHDRIVVTAPKLYTPVPPSTLPSEVPLPACLAADLTRTAHELYHKSSAYTRACGPYLEL